MKHPILFGALFGSTILGATIALALAHPEIPFTEEALSTVVNLPHIYPLFIIGGILFSILLTIFVYFAFTAIGHNTRKVRTILFSILASGIALIISPYNDHQLVFKWSHTILGFIVMVLVVLLAWEFSKVKRPAEKALSWLTNITPKAMGIGTAGLFIFTGINLIMELYFFTLVCLWLILVGITVKKSKE